MTENLAPQEPGGLAEGISHSVWEEELELVGYQTGPEQLSDSWG